MSTANLRHPDASVGLMGYDDGQHAPQSAGDVNWSESYDTDPRQTGSPLVISATLSASTSRAQSVPSTDSRHTHQDRDSSLPLSMESSMRSRHDNIELLPESYPQTTLEPIKARNRSYRGQRQSQVPVPTSTPVPLFAAIDQEEGTKHDQLQLTGLGCQQLQERHQDRRQQQEDRTTSLISHSSNVSKRHLPSNSHHDLTPHGQDVHSLNNGFTSTGTSLEQDENSYKANSGKNDNYIPKIVWIRQKGNIRQLYGDGLTRQQIFKIVSEDFGQIKPTYTQFCTRLDRWGLYTRIQDKQRNGRDRHVSKTPSIIMSY